MTSILLVDDHEIVFSGIDLLLSVENRKCDLTHVIDGAECEKILKVKTFDLIILDVNIPNTDSIRLLTTVLNTYPKQKILVYSMSSEELYAKRLLQLGAMGYISKNSSNKEFLKAIDTVLNGQKYISEFLKNLITNEIINNKKSGNVFDRLSTREFEVMNLFLKGNGSKEVANFTQLHSSTVGTYKIKIFEKLGVSNFLELQELAKLYGLV
jgi:DNA-binding NarL/FixJ family response regulator